MLNLNPKNTQKKMSTIKHKLFQSRVGEPQVESNLGITLYNDKFK